jgi:putative acetyltransferase
MPGLQLRRVRVEDVPAVVELVRRTLAEFGIVFGVGAQTDDQLLALPASYEDAGGAFFVVELDGALVGTAGMYRQSAASYELRKMYLDGAARGRGVGQRLLEVCIAFVREQGGQRVVLDTTEQMTAAISFYEKNGFVRDDEQITASRCSRGYRLEL